MSIKPLRAFPENSTIGKQGPNYTCTSYLMMDIADLCMSHFGQSPKEYDWKKVKEHIRRFNEFYGTKLSYKIVFETFEKESSEMEDGEYEWKDVKEFEKFWNRHAL